MENINSSGKIKNYQDEREYLKNAAETGNASLIRQFLEKYPGEQFEDTIKVGFYAACIYSNEEAIAQFFKPPGYISPETAETGLHYAASRGKNEIVAYLLEKSTNPEMALTTAAIYGHKETTELILDSVDVSQDTYGLALYHAAAQGNRNVCEILVERGATLDQKDFALFAASNYGKNDVVEYLLEKRGRCRPALKYAAQEGHTDVCQTLLNSGDYDLASVKEAFEFAKNTNNDDIGQMIKEYVEAQKTRLGAEKDKLLSRDKDLDR